jgi:XTP/dITP diphosphohydrolase
MKELIVATQNRHKFAEIRKILSGLPVKLTPLFKFKTFPDVIEDKKTLKGNASKKARVIAKYFGKWALSDDSGLAVDHLNGRPGVFSARFAGENCTYEDNNRKLLRLMKKAGPNKRGAVFSTVIALSSPDGKVTTVEGKVRGVISDRPLGSAGFGYDPFFLVPEFNKTYAQMGNELKNRISHRAIALKKAKLMIKEIIKN